jgi:hypothetical protein
MLWRRSAAPAAPRPRPRSVRRLADRIRRRDRAVDQRAEATDRRSVKERSAKGPNPGAQQLRLAAEPLQPTGGALARALDALQALLAALADRNQLGFDLTAALDRQSDGIGVGASGHDLGSLDDCASRKRTAGRPGPCCAVRYQAHCGPAVSRVRWRELAQEQTSQCRRRSGFGALQVFGSKRRGRYAGSQLGPALRSRSCLVQ